MKAKIKIDINKYDGLAMFGLSKIIHLVRSVILVRM